jgi:phospholipase C
MLVISPWSRNVGARTDPGWGPLVCGDTLDHTSMLRFLQRLFAAKAVPGIEIPHDTSWRSATVGDLTGAFSFSSRNGGVPTLPATSLVSPLTYPECDLAGLTEIPGTTPPAAYVPSRLSFSLPVQEGAALVRRPTGLVCPSQ